MQFLIQCPDKSTFDAVKGLIGRTVHILREISSKNVIMTGMISNQMVLEIKDLGASVHRTA